MKTLIRAAITGYKNYLSPFLPRSCRFHPSCSNYSLEAVKKYGAMKGLWMSARRIAKCHPLHPGGYDPVDPLDTSC